MFGENAIIGFFGSSIVQDDHSKYHDNISSRIFVLKIESEILIRAILYQIRQMR